MRRDRQEYRQRKRHEDQVRRAAVRASYEQTRQKYQSMVKKFYSRWAGITFGQKGAPARPTPKESRGYLIQTISDCEAWCMLQARPKRLSRLGPLGRRR